MNNLFVLHTQYNLLLAIGLCQTDFKGDNNNLILFKDFHLIDRHIKSIEKSFRNYMMLSGCFPEVNLTPKMKLEKIITDNKAIDDFITSKYDRVFIVEDMCIQEMYVMKCAKQINVNSTMYWLEDGANAYFSNNEVSKGMGANSFRRWIRKNFFKLRFGLGKYYDLGPCMGSHYLLKNGYFMYPEVARIEFSDRKRLLISSRAFETGMKEMFGGNENIFNKQSILIALDKLSVYGPYLSVVKNQVTTIVKKAKQENKTVYYKYHPRETERLFALNECCELNRMIAIESYLINSNTKDIKIIGFKSTALQTAKKLGYETISYIKQVEPNNIAIRQFYEAIGIVCE